MTFETLNSVNINQFPLMHSIVSLAAVCVVLQVDYMIQDATSLENLAVLYEGWTPWV